MRRSDLATIPEAIRSHLLIASQGAITLTNWQGAIVPSPCGVERDCSFRFKLSNGSTSSYTVVCGPVQFAPGSEQLCLTEYLDYFICPRAGDYKLEIELVPELTAQALPSLLVARRPQEEVGGASYEQGEIDLQVPEISQISYEPLPLAHRRFCLPVCITMISKYFGLPHSFETVRDLCLNTATNTYGIWPHNIAAVHCLGLGGAVIFISSLSEVMGLLSAGIPVMANLRFSEGGIPDFPFGSTKGHMVVVRGASPAEVIVNDPAQSLVIKRRYPVALFMEIWTKSRPEIGCAVGMVFWKR